MELVKSSAISSHLLKGTIFRCIIPVVLEAITEGVGYVKTQLSCILLIMLTTCFGHYGPSSGHKNVYRGKLYLMFIGPCVTVKVAE